MYNRDMLTGIYLAHSKIDFHIEHSNTVSIGYTVRIRVNLRAELDFLEGVKRSLFQHGIESVLKEKENKTRPKPILKIGGIKNLYLLTEMVSDLPDSKNEWSNFRKAVEIISNKEHLELEGIEKLMELKGVL